MFSKPSAEEREKRAASHHDTERSDQACGPVDEAFQANVRGTLLLLTDAGYSVAGHFGCEGGLMIDLSLKLLRLKSGW
jgi:hypothetical protein